MCEQFLRNWWLKDKSVRLALCPADSPFEVQISFHTVPTGSFLKLKTVSLDPTSFRCIPKL